MNFIATDKRTMILLLFILVFSIFLRFYNYENRWGLAYDQARDVIVARQALKTLQMPLIGPFASAGQFVYGPQWFWALMVMISLFPKAILTPWVFLTVLYVAMVYVMFLVGRKTQDTYLGLLAAMFTCVSTAQVLYATNLTSPSMVGVVSILTVYFFIRYIRQGKVSDAFLLGFGIGNSINIHFQAIGLLVLIPVALLFGERSFKRFLFMLCGLIIPFIPLIIFDFKTSFFESRNILDYYLHGQYQIYIPNRWLTYAGVFWPLAWSRIIGGNIVLGYLIIVSTTFVTLYTLISRKLTKELLSVIIAFVLVFLWLRYYRGQMFDTNLVFLHPFVLLLTAWTSYQIFKLQKNVGILSIAIFILGSMQLNIHEIQNAGNQTAIDAHLWSRKLIEKFSNEKFSVYDYKYKYRDKTLPLVLYLWYDEKIDDSGRKIGLSIATTSAELRSTFGDYPVVHGEVGGYELFDLSASREVELSRKEWALVNPSQIYDATENWYKHEKR